MLREADHFGSSHVTFDISLARGERQPPGRRVLCSFPTCPHQKKAPVTHRGLEVVTPLLQKGGPASPLSPATPASSQTSYSYLLSIRMTYCNHGTWCTLALHPLVSLIDSYMQSPPSKPFRSRSPPPPPRRAGAQPGLPLRPSTPQPYVCFQMMLTLDET